MLFCSFQLVLETWCQFETGLLLMWSYSILVAISVITYLSWSVLTFSWVCPVSVHKQIRRATSIFPGGGISLVYLHTTRHHVYNLMDLVYHTIWDSVSQAVMRLITSLTLTICIIALCVPYIMPLWLPFSAYLFSLLSLFGNEELDRLKGFWHILA